MPDSPQTQLPLTPDTPSTASGGMSTAAAPVSPPVAPALWRAGPEAPSWARGKTAEEIMQITGNLMDTVVRSTPPAAAAPPTPGTAPAPLDPNAYTTGQDLLNAQQAAIAQFQPALQRMAEQNAASTYRVVANDDRFRDVFQRYGPEISTYLARVPKAEWNVDIVEGAAKLVRADHLDELARERANQIVQGMEPTIRPTGGGAAPASPTPDLSLKSEKLPTDWRDRAAKVGLSERELDEFCFANGLSREQFFKQFEQDLIVEVGRVKGA